MKLRCGALLFGLLAGCGSLEGLLPGPHDGGHAKVPGTYLDARFSAGHRTHLALEGEKQLQCADCHFVSDAGFRAGAVKPCVECHRKQQEHHHPLDGGVLGDDPATAVTLPPMTCMSCHLFRSQGPGRWGCVRCHKEQVEVHWDRCGSCHRPHGTPFTRAADCGQCHDVTVKHGKGEKHLVADTCMTCHPHHTKAAVAASRCSSCHEQKQAALFPKGHEGCGTCHSNHTFTSASAKSCSSCHAKHPVLAPDAHPACTSCHNPHAARAAPKSCESCHTKVHPQHPFPVAGQTCTGCHPPHAGITAKTCGDCHKFESTPVVHAKTTSCADCHKEPHAGKPSRAGLCESCHKDQHALVKLNKGHAKCDDCHKGLPHAPQPPPACLSCHAKQEPAQKGHTACDSCHQSHSAQVIKRCTDCHDKPLPGLHGVKKHQQCDSCHRPHLPQPGFGPQSCQSCHKELSKKSHPTPPQQCVSCHLFSPPK